MWFQASFTDFLLVGNINKCNISIPQIRFTIILVRRQWDTKINIEDAHPKHICGEKHESYDLSFVSFPYWIWHRCEESSSSNKFTEILFHQSSKSWSFWVAFLSVFRIFWSWTFLSWTFHLDWSFMSFLHNIRIHFNLQLIFYINAESFWNVLFIPS